jgi:hypothetical protein
MLLRFYDVKNLLKLCLLFCFDTSKREKVKLIENKMSYPEHEVRK